jgi:hypothetical protein
MHPRSLLLPLFAVLAVGCLGSLRHDATAEAILLAPREVLGLPVRDNRPYWLLRGTPGWRSAHEIRFGGNPSDPAVATVRVARFRDADAARAAYARLTPAYLYAAYRDRMTDEPVPFDYPEPLPGDEVATYLYGVKLPATAPEGATLLGQLTALRAGSAVLLVESIGVEPDQLVPALAELVRRAHEVEARP